MESKSMPMSLRELLAKLHFLAQINRGNKANLSDMSVSEASSWYGALLRSWKGESRKTTLNAVEKIIAETIDALRLYKNDEYYCLITKRLLQARTGIEKMQETYNEDLHTLSRIRVILDEIDHHLRGSNDLSSSPPEDIRPLTTTIPLPPFKCTLPHINTSPSLINHHNL